MPTDLGRPTDIKIGADRFSMEDVKVEPFVEFFDATDTERAVGGGDRCVGPPRCRWTYPDRELTGEQYYQLHNILNGNASANVVIDVPTNEVDPGNDYKPIVQAYNAIMHWPKEGVRRIRHNRWEMPDDGILFSGLEAIN